MLAVYPYLKMTMAASRVAGGAAKGYHVSSMDRLPVFNLNGAVMGIKR